MSTVATVSLDDVLAGLKEQDCAPQIRAHWDQAMAAMPSSRPAFLQHGQIRDAWEHGSFGESMPQELLKLADRVAGDPHLLAMAWFIYWYTFGPVDRTWSWTKPELTNCLGEDAGLFYLLVALAFIPAVHEYHKTLPVTPRVTEDTCRQVHCFTLNHRRGMNGRWGVYRNQFGWLGNYLAPNLYMRVGRFEYWRQSYKRGFRVYRQIATGATVVLAPDKSTYTAQGHQCFNPSQPPAGTWQSVFSEDADAVSGNPISPRGKAMSKVVKLDKKQWRCVLAPGDTVLDMHIPAGGQMGPQACRESFEEAARLFCENFADDRPKAITCGSWMLSEQLEECLPEQSNLVQLVKEIYVLPLPCVGNDGMWFVFLQEKFDPATAPRDTSLRRDMLNYLNKGNVWRNAGMIVMLDDIRHFGTQYYRRQWDSLSLA